MATVYKKTCVSYQIFTNGCIGDAINKASLISREDALVDKTNDNQLTRVPFVVTCNPKLPSLPKILKESQSILRSSKRCATVFPEVPLISYRRSRNLSDMLRSRRLAPNDTTKPIETMTPAAATTITLIKVPTPIKTTRVMRATMEMNVLNVDVHLKIQKAYKYINPLNITASKTRRHLLDSGLVALIKDVTFVNRKNSARPCLVRKTRKNIKSNSQSHVKLKTFPI